MLVFLRKKYYQRMLKANIFEDEDITFILNRIDFENSRLIKSEVIFFGIYDDSTTEVLYNEKTYKIKYTTKKGCKNLVGIFTIDIISSTDYSNE